MLQSSLKQDTRCYKALSTHVERAGAQTLARYIHSDRLYARLPTYPPLPAITATPLDLLDDPAPFCFDSHHTALCMMHASHQQV